ncbi:MAG: selenium-dependent molybdenum cofactor biosynthesis protein YqeB [Anaerolineales bacterium]|jgi:xanthine dehydrogenase accessory factor
MMGAVILIRGGGDLATGVAARLHRSGFGVLVTEVAQPLAIRRLVALAEAVYAGQVLIEDLHGRRVETLESGLQVIAQGELPVLVDPDAECRHVLQPLALIDGRMRKTPPELGKQAAPLVIGLGPGFNAGLDCHAVIETNRGHHLGRVLWQGHAEMDTGVPAEVAGKSSGRVLRAPASGVLKASVALGSLVRKGDTLAMVDGAPLKAVFDGVLRGLLHDGLEVAKGDKIGDLDPRLDPSYAREISDKSLAVGGGVLEALLSSPAVCAALRP